MRYIRLLSILFFITVFLMTITASFAVNGDINDINNNTYENIINTNLQEETTVEINELSENLEDNSENLISENDDNNLLSSGKTIVVDEVDKNHNEMSSPTIQKAIDSASDGDTIIVNGESYVHCHFVINKKLTIISNVGTTLSPCSSKMTSNHQGIFYISPQASGTVIEGFTLTDTGMLSDVEGYGILIKGASDVVVRNCKISTGDMADSIRFENAKNCMIQNVTLFESVNGIKIINSNSVTLKNNTIKKNDYGIVLMGSDKTNIVENNIFSNNIAGITVGEKCSNSVIISNNITSNKFSGVNLSSAEYVDIISNYIAANKFGVYVNCNITKVNIKGNFFNKNSLYEIYNDYRVRNLVDKSNPKQWIAYEDLEVIDNNYMIGLNERPVYTNSYTYIGKNRGDYSYNSASDTFKYVGSGKGDYINQKSVSFLRYVFELNEYVSCPSIFFNYPEYWYNGDYELQLSEITQNKKGEYSISITDSKGNIAKELSSIYVTFFLNKANTDPNPGADDIYRTVLMKNGTATVKFNLDEFRESNNTISVFLPGANKEFLYKTYRTLDIADNQIPGNIVDTKFTVSNFNTYPSSKEYLAATLKDANGNLVTDKVVTIEIFSKTYHVTTNSKGQAKLPINQPRQGTYSVIFRFVGDDSEYNGCTAKCNVIVKKQSSKIISSNVFMIPKLTESYKITLKDGNGKVIANQKILFEVNGKKYTKTTNSKGQASVSLKFTAEKKYKISITYSGNNKYKASSKRNTITVKYSSKVSKLTAPKVSVTPNTQKNYLVTLSDANGKGIAKQKVTIKINGKTYTRTTNSKGQASVGVKLSSIKNYKVVVNYKGNKIYKKSSATGNIKVSKLTTVISASNLNTYPKSHKLYTVTLKTNTGKSLSKQPIYFKVVGKVYTAKTDNNGRASLPINLITEKSYPIISEYKGNAIYNAAKASKTIKIEKIPTSISSYDKTFAADSNKEFAVTLNDNSGKALANQKIIFTYNGKSSSQSTDSKGVAKVLLSSDSSSFKITTKFNGNSQYKAVSKNNVITISNKTNTVFINQGLSSDEIQRILDDAESGSDVEFLGDSYSDISLNINKKLNIYPSKSTTLIGKSSKPVFTLTNSDINISNFTIVASSNSGIAMQGADNVNIINNIISNKLDESKMNDYNSSVISLPGYGIDVSNSKNIYLSNNEINLFESGIFAESSSSIFIDNNTLRENNYGVKYGYDVSGSEITNNLIKDSIGLYTFDVPEGPRGYGIFLNNSAVNVSVIGNTIVWNHLGISIDANKSTGIVIKSNKISDNVLEGIRFNAGYDLADGAVEPIVTDNAIYRNARGPSMMTLGELSANPGGIYGPGEWNDSLKLQLGPNWYGKNAIVTWDYETGVVGYGTMCPRINTTPISFKEIKCIAPGKFSVTFYKNGEIATDLAEFELFATLNNNTEICFNVVGGVGTFNFDKSSFDGENNVIGISSGSLSDESRTFTYFYSYNVPETEILK